MKTKPLLQGLLMLATICLAALPHGALAKVKNADESRLFRKYNDTLSQLRRDLTQKLPRLNDKSQVDAFLASDKFDDHLVKLAILTEATPDGLAKFAAQSRDNERLIDQLFSSPPLMKQMLLADGAKHPDTRKNPTLTGAQYGPAVKIYADIRKASPKSKDGVLHQLALAVALEHSVPINDTFNPVERYLDFEKAYLGGELDPAFANFDAWELRFVVDGNEPDWARAWGREMLRNLRPDHILTTKQSNRYSGMVKTNVLYGSDRVRQDRPELNFYQNILMNGGVCGRRAFFGRFILRCFGIPTIARPTPGHAALGRWTPKGWVIYLGPNWGKGWTHTIYGGCRNFLATSQARQNKEQFIQVKRAQWAGDVLGETRQYKGPGDDKSWSGISLVTQQRIIDNLKAVVLPPVDEKFGEADDNDDERIEVDSALARNRREAIRKPAPGEINIPLESYRLSRPNTPRVNLMDGYFGGKQFHFGHIGRSGVNIYRGGSATGDPDECSSESRIREAGRGGYPNWGARIAMTPKPGETTPQVTLDLGNGVTMDFIYVKPGKFIMGGENSVQTKFNCVNTPKHEVTITKGYYLAKTELTRAQFAAGSDKAVKNPDHPQQGVRISTLELHFFDRVNEATGRELRLPTEAEWEYAARAGTTTRWFFGDNPSKLGEYAWYGNNSDKSQQPVGKKRPNPWGFHDMLGNAWEIVADVYDKDYFAQGPKVDPTGPSSGAGSEIEFTINVPRPGRYALTARVCTMNFNQSINVSLNDDPTETRIMLPFTLGKWQDTEPVVLQLKQGQNVLKLCRRYAPTYGISLNALTLKPVR